MKTKVLSVQSHVVHGYVGNKCASFCLQRSGIEVDTIHTVQFSNHSEYPTFRGRRLEREDLEKLILGLHENNLDHYTHILTGYIGNKGVLLGTLDLIKKLKEKNAELCFVCDPVMGDDGKLYLPQELIEIYKTDAIPLADVLLPNRLEAEALSGLQICDIASADTVCQQLHTTGPHTIVLTTMEDPDAPPGNLTMFASTVLKQEAGHPAKFKIHIPKIEENFKGTGDLIAALVLALLQERPKELDWVCEQAISRLQCILTETQIKFKENNSKFIELDLIASQHFLVQPTLAFKAIHLD